MAKRQRRQIDYQSLESRDLVWLVQVDNDPQASELLLERKDEVIRRLVKNCIRKYTFVDGDDMYQSVVLNFCKIIKTYRPGKAGTDWDKYCYHRLTFMIKDILRQRDDLGIGWPQKKMYPDWFHLYDKSDASDGCHADLIADHREQLGDEPETNFREYVADTLQTLATVRQQARNLAPANRAKHDEQPCAWSQSDTGQAKYSWLDPLPTKRKRGGVKLSPWSWHVARSKPKQKVLF